MKGQDRIYFLLQLIKICLGAADSNTFVRHTGSYTHHRLGIAHWTESAVRCAGTCMLSHTGCNAYSYNSSSGTCQLHRHVCHTKKGDEEIFVKTNVDDPVNTKLALGKPASISSQYGFYVASIGNDGIYHRDAYTPDSGGDLALIFHTEWEWAPWWRVNLENDYCVSAVYFLNRGYELWSRTKDVVITVAEAVTDIEDNGDNVCGRIIGEAERWDNLVTCTQPLIGRFVQLKCMTYTAFHLYEVEVHGY